jgi:hypothetical protein
MVQAFYPHKTNQAYYAENEFVKAFILEKLAFHGIGA